MSQNTTNSKERTIKFTSPKPKRPLNLLPEGTKPNFGQRAWLEKHELIKKAKNYGNQNNFMNSVVYKVKPDESNNRY